MLQVEAQIEIDVERGVVYVHSKETGCTPIRICGIPIDRERLRMLGIDASVSLDISMSTDNVDTIDGKV